MQMMNEPWVGRCRYLDASHKPSTIGNFNKCACYHVQTFASQYKYTTGASHPSRDWQPLKRPLCRPYHYQIIILLTWQCTSKGPLLNQDFNVNAKTQKDTWQHKLKGTALDYKKAKQKSLPVANWPEISVAQCIVLTELFHVHFVKQTEVQKPHDSQWSCCTAASCGC